MKYPDPTLLVLMGYENVPTHIELVLEGTAVVPVAALGDIPRGPYGRCIVVLPRVPLTPDERFPLNAWIKTSVEPRLTDTGSLIYV